MKQYFKSLMIFFLFMTLLGATASSFGAAEKNQKTTAPIRSTAPLFNQLGNFHHPVTTRSPLAQRGDRYNVGVMSLPQDGEVGHHCHE